jgi:N-acetylmuramoyl-L-alanine amidase
MLPFTYLLKVMLCSTVFFGYYLFVLRNKRFHQYNRFYLLFSIAASWLVPLIKLPIITGHEWQQPVYQAYTFISETNAALEFEPTQQMKASFDWLALLPVLYAVVATALLLGIVISLLKIYRIYKIYPKQKIENVVLLNTIESGTPFSFLKYIFWNREIDVNSRTGMHILQHELTHVREKHSWDKIFMQVNLVFGWFNPCFWLIKKELEMIHEFIADNKAMANPNAADLASMLLVATFPAHQYKLTNPFFFSPIKRRLTMFTQKKSPRHSYVRRVIALPLLAIVVLLFAFRQKENAVSPSITGNSLLSKKYKVVIDAGHGGTDLGCKSPDGTVFEKDIDLAIANKIMQLNNNKNIEIVLVRNDDHFDAVKEKAAIINNQKADLCISIHCSDAGKNEKENGTVIYVAGPGKNNGFMNESNSLAQSVNGILKGNFVNRGIKTNKQGIWILQAANCPIILLEAGCLSNMQDVEILKNVDKQALIAKNILKGTEDYLARKEKR